MVEQVIKKMEEADLVLVGIGEELDVFSCVKKDEGYLERALKIEKSKSEWMLPFLRKEMAESREKEKAGIYEALASCLAGKNYFIVSLCQDGLLERSGIDQGRMVSPCGSYEQLQCSKKCSTELYPSPRGLIGQIETFLHTGQEGDRPREPLCPRCGSSLVFNNVDAADYVEEGYLGGWNRYKKWLQGTLNRKLCILELGVGMKYPTVVRWPFEKIAFFNQKAEFFRVHEKLYQVAEEISGRAYGICQKPEEFLMELCLK